jgi:iron complex transport system ATP-binding protein
MAELRGVRHVAGGTTILDDVSLRFRAGAFNVILGPNGAGKSTLLRAATGLLRPSAGSVLLDGRPVREYEPAELARKRAVLSQHVELAFPLPVREVVLMGRYPHYARVPAPRDLAIVDEALALVGMHGRRQQPYPTLSGGEQQKVQLARVLAQIWSGGAGGGGDTPPHRYLFLDEPTSSLDIHYQLQLLRVVRELPGHDCTVIAVLHDLNLAFEHADHVVLMDRGRIAWKGDARGEPPAALLERVFGVRARKVEDPASTHGIWRFAL